MRQERIQRLRNVILTAKDGIDAGYEMEVVALASVTARHNVLVELLDTNHTSETARRLRYTTIRRSLSGVKLYIVAMHYRHKCHHDNRLHILFFTRAPLISC